MARLAGLVLVVCAFAAAGQAPKGVPCRNVKSEAQCIADERAKAGVDQATDVRTSVGAVLVEKITVEANPEDRAAPELSRWEKFERGLQGEKVVEFVGNDGVRMMCLDPCKRGFNCCQRGREFTTTGREAGR